MLKKLLSLLLIVVMMFSLTGCSDILGGAFFFFLIATGDDRADQSEIIEFVCENEAELMSAIESGNFSEFENQGFIKTIDADDAAVEFSCGGAGVGSGTSYVGFYYTPDGDMTAVWCAPASEASLIPCGSGFEWREKGGDDRYYTEQICGNFYYYEASF